MLISKVPVLDNGYVSLIASSLNKSRREDVLSSYKINCDKLVNLSNATLLVNCPVAVYCVLSQIQGATFAIAESSEEEYYLPDVADIGASDLETSREINQDMYTVTCTLVNNKEAYKADGARPEVAGMLTPVSKYIVVVMSCPYTILKKSCEEMLSYNNIIIQQYAKAIEQVLIAEF